MQVCRRCGSDDVAMVGWVTVNGRKWVDDHETVQDTYCYGCDEPTELMDDLDWSRRDHDRALDEARDARKDGYDNLVEVCRDLLRGL